MAAGIFESGVYKYLIDDRHLLSYLLKITRNDRIYNNVNFQLGVKSM